MDITVCDICQLVIVDRERCRQKWHFGDGGPRFPVPESPISDGRTAAAASAPSVVRDAALMVRLIGTCPR